MEELTERERKLLEFLKVMINFMTIWGIYEHRVKEMRDWAFQSMNAAGATTEWQDEMLKVLETDYGLKYNKLDDKGNPLKEDGN